MFKVDLVGRVSKMKITKNEVLLPLYEAVVNAFQSIEESHRTNDAQIKIKVIRDTSQEVFENMKTEESYPIDGFVITDNGVGFTEKNFNSFLTSDSTYKKDKGGKGIGRFIWLKTFNNISVNSVYEEKGIKLRKFSFVLKEDPIENLECSNYEGEIGTEIKLEDLKLEYKEKLPRSIEKIGMKIIEHCLEYFIQENAPRVIIEDDFDMIDLNKKLKQDLAINMHKESFEIKNSKFDICHVKLFESEGHKNRIHYCAHWREVKTESLDSSIPDLNGKINDGEKDFVYSAYISSSLLDDIVNDERTDFNYKMLSGDLINNDVITKREIEDGILKVISNHLKDYIEPIKKEKKEYIEGYIKKEKPQYRPLLKYKENEIEKIRRNLNKDELELELFKIQQQFQYEVKKQGEEFLDKNRIKDIKKLDEYKEKYLEYIEKENEIGKSTLAGYIVHRKVIIDLLEKSMGYDDSNKYELESYVHNLIFPMKTISDDIDYESHNLWLIDERLSYHYYLASDIKMKKIDTINVDTDERPDVLILDNPVALSNEENKPYNAMTIIEFKRPMRDDYNDDENPISQVLTYTSEIRSGSVKDKRGRMLQISESAPFYLYIIADLTPKLIRQAQFANLKRTPDGMGFFGYNDSREINAYIEIISYEKLLIDAKKRNNILFDKLFK